MADDPFDDAWIRGAAASLGVAAPSAELVSELLAAAAAAAHGSGDRRNAPLLCALVGASIGPRWTGDDVAEVRRLVAAAAGGDDGGPA